MHRPHWQRVTHPSKSNRRAARSQTFARPPRLLIADDDPVLLALLVEAFRDDGYDVTEVSDGVELLRLTTTEELEAHRFDAIISDVLLPGVSGIGMLMQLQHEPNAPPVVLITGFGDNDVHAWAQQLGAAATFNKPFELDDLKTVVVNLAPVEKRASGSRYRI